MKIMRRAQDSALILLGWIMALDAEECPGALEALHRSVRHWKRCALHGFGMTACSGIGVYASIGLHCPIVGKILLLPLGALGIVWWRNGVLGGTYYRQGKNYQISAWAWTEAARKYPPACRHCGEPMDPERIAPKIPHPSPESED